MRVFLDFEASSLADRSYPVEVGWVFEDGRGEDHLIAPAPDWIDWDERSAAIHGLDRATLIARGEAHDRVARRMVDVLDGHRLFASAPSWDGKWLSVLLRAAGLPRHTLRLHDTDEALREAARDVLAPVLADGRLEQAVAEIIARANAGGAAQPAHRALAERDKWLFALGEARALATRHGAPSDRAGDPA